MHLFHQLAFGPDRKQDLDQAGPDQALGCYGGAPKIGIERSKLAIQADERIIDHLPDFALRVSGRDALLKIDVAEQRPHRLIRPAHFRPPPIPCEGGTVFSNRCRGETFSAPC